MDRNKRKQLLEQYKQVKTYMGVYKITNTVNGKVYIGSCPNLKNKWLTLRGQLDMNRFANAALQQEWNELGAEAFHYEVLEQKELTEDTDRKWAPKQLENAWLEKIQPYDDNGYNKKPK
ncbi:GIY-YIG nuclease family protein [Bacillus tuaregi]|uniref:GIY-YIG nuclease family protein n=1 Tax=Bacillus tuaregi TaxID=1816695 RepID=UPI0008F84D5A|nr:GIY-YIG nuclease family protein [Bacillus tuaregi]